MCLAGLGKRANTCLAFCLTPRSIFKPCGKAMRPSSDCVALYGLVTSRVGRCDSSWSCTVLRNEVVSSPLAVERALEAKAYAGADNPKAADKWVLGLVCRFETEGPSRLGRVVPESRFKDSRSSRDSDMLSGISKIEVWP